MTKPKPIRFDLFSIAQLNPFKLILTAYGGGFNSTPPVANLKGMDHYKTIRTTALAKLVRKGSRFLALAFPVTSPA
ncbi:MAG: hypothetical protein ACUVQU_07020, partial [Candidatus Bipolaricaulia bacterium]